MRQVVGAAVRRVVATAARSAAPTAKGAAAAPVGGSVALLETREADIVAVDDLLRANVAQQLLDVRRGLALRQPHGRNWLVRVDTVCPRHDHVHLVPDRCNTHMPKGIARSVAVLLQTQTVPQARSLTQGDQKRSRLAVGSR